jgi:hypothetical protein
MHIGKSVHERERDIQKKWTRIRKSVHERETSRNNGCRHYYVHVCSNMLTNMYVHTYKQTYRNLDVYRIYVRASVYTHTCMRAQHNINTHSTAHACILHQDHHADRGGLYRSFVVQIFYLLTRVQLATGALGSRDGLESGDESGLYVHKPPCKRWDQCKNMETKVCFMDACARFFFLGPFGDR